MKTVEAVQYKTIPLGVCRDLLAERLDGGEPEIGAHVETKGSGDPLDMDRIENAAIAVADLREKRGPTKRDSIEGAAAIVLYEAVEHLPAMVLNDPGFWRYLSFAYDGFWEFAAWRHREQLGKPKSFSKYVDAKRPRECVLTRMFLRVHALHGDGDDDREYRDLAASIKTNAADFWRAHIVRVQTGKSPAVARSLARRQREDDLPRNVIREFAKIVNRIHANVVTAIYDDEEADAFILDLREEFDRERGEE